MVDLFLSDLPSGQAVLAVDCQQALLSQQGEWMKQAAIGGMSSSSALAICKGESMVMVVTTIQGFRKSIASSR